MIKRLVYDLSKILPLLFFLLLLLVALQLVYSFFKTDHSITYSIRKGDIILFYRSKDRKSIQCMGIVEDVLFSENIDEVFPTIAKRTVYSYSDLLKILKKNTLVILFRYIALDKEISYQQIVKAKVEGYIQSIRKIDNQQYSALIHEN